MISKQNVNNELLHFFFGDELHYP